ncbi:DUF899 domain-containing protein [Chitinophaga eiseniae]|uniref:DUF899 domain-containing protein n=1 Tax=Chitinophaga eiseniae TaxID=634771 RepID=A0A847SVS1_9BACT|nr:thioredoxin family protein [Chitinophaga eiseniae]NLR80962.1 DUF899 domain-containing protein [Chitinophaga eiseniae]
MSTNASAGLTSSPVKPGFSPQVVSSEEWLVARKKFLEKEKRLTRLRDELSRERMALPWVKVEKEYVFEGPDGKVTLSDLFDGRSQLIIQHFMLGPNDAEGCVGCSFAADSIDGALPHLENHDVSLVVVARAPFPKLDAFKKRMGWKFPWVSSAGNDFNYDYHVSFHKADIEKGKVAYNYSIITDLPVHMEDLPGLSCFYKDETGTIYHTYSTYARGGELQLVTYNYLDIAPLGRNEGTGTNLSNWVRHHDKYDSPKMAPGSCCSSAEGAS